MSSQFIIHVCLLDSFVRFSPDLVVVLSQFTYVRQRFGIATAVTNKLNFWCTDNMHPKYFSRTRRKYKKPKGSTYRSHYWHSSYARNLCIWIFFLCAKRAFFGRCCRRSCNRSGSCCCSPIHFYQNSHQSHASCSPTALD